MFKHQIISPYRNVKPVFCGELYWKRLISKALNYKQWSIEESSFSPPRWVHWGYCSVKWQQDPGFLMQ